MADQNEKWICAQSGPLSAASKYMLYVSGPCGSKEIRNLIRALEMQAEWLAADEAASPKAVEPPGYTQYTGYRP